MRTGVDSDAAGAKTRRIRNRLAGRWLQVRQSRAIAVSPGATGVELQPLGSFDHRFAHALGVGAPELVEGARAIGGVILTATRGATASGVSGDAKARPHS